MIAFLLAQIGKIKAAVSSLNSKTDMYGNLADGTDLDTLMDANKSAYLSIARTYPHHPNPGVPTFLSVFNGTDATTYLVQIAWQKDRIFIRKKYESNGASWGAWQYIQMGGCGWLASGTNINDITVPGTYGISGNNSYTGLPTGVTSGILEVIAPAATDTYIIQRLTIASAHYERYRSASNGSSFGTWYKYTGTQV